MPLQGNSFAACALLWTTYRGPPSALVSPDSVATISCGYQPGRPQMTQLNWTDDRVEQLKNLWTEGLSASQIARALGGVTRNAVIGKVHRLGLAGRASPSRSERPRVSMSPKVPSLRTHVPAAPIVEEDPLTLEDGNFATVLTISDRMCRWPIGDPAATEFHFCGRLPTECSPFCEAHARKAYQPQQARRTDKGRMAS